MHSTATVANTVPTKFTFTSYTVAMPMPSMSGSSVSFTASGAGSPPITACWSTSVTGMHASFESWYMPTVLFARFRFMNPTEPSEPSAILYTPEKLASLYRNKPTCSSTRMPIVVTPKCMNERKTM